MNVQNLAVSFKKRDGNGIVYTVDGVYGQDQFQYEFWLEIDDRDLDHTHTGGVDFGKTEGYDSDVWLQFTENVCDMIYQESQYIAEFG